MNFYFNKTTKCRVRVIEGAEFIFQVGVGVKYTLCVHKELEGYRVYELNLYGINFLKKVRKCVDSFLDASYKIVEKYNVLNIYYCV